MIPDRYQLTETATAGYVERTQLNIKAASVTLIFTLGPMTPGSKLTFEYANRFMRRVRHFDLLKQSELEVTSELCDWLLERIICPGLMNPDTPVFTINVAGSRESKASGLQIRVARIMTVVLSHLTEEYGYA